MNSHVLFQVAPNLRALIRQHVIQNSLISLRQSHLPLCVWIRATHRDLDNQTADVTWMMRPWLRLLQFKWLHQGWGVGGLIVCPSLFRARRLSSRLRYSFYPQQWKRFLTKSDFLHSNNPKKSSKPHPMPSWGVWASFTCFTFTWACSFGLYCMSSVATLTLRSFMRIPVY